MNQENQTKLEPIGNMFCKGSIEIGSGCMRCGRCAVSMASRITELEAQLSAIGAGGVEALRKRDQDVGSSITIDFKQSTELLEMFGGEPAEITLMEGDGHSGNGLYAIYTDMPEEGSGFLGTSDNEAIPLTPAQEHATQLAGQGQAVPQFRKPGCADWYDGFADQSDGGGPYEERTLYAITPAHKDEQA